MEILTLYEGDFKIHKSVTLEDLGEFLIFDPEIEYEPEIRRATLKGALLTKHDWHFGRLQVMLAKPVKYGADIFYVPWTDYHFIVKTTVKK